MCAPVLAAVAIVGAVVSAYGQYQQGQAAKKAGDYNAAIQRNNAIVQRNNAEMARRAAEDAIKRGDLAAQQEAQKTAALKGRQRVVLAANGVLVDTGSALDLTTDTSKAGALSELQIKNNAEREALGYKMNAYNFESGAVNSTAQAGLDVFQGNSAAQAGKTAAAGTLLKSASSVASKWYDSGGLTNATAWYDVNYNPSTKNLF